MNPEEKDELEKVAHRINRGRAARGIAAVFLIVALNVGATVFFVNQILDRIEHAAASSSAGQRGLRCIIRDAREDQPEDDQQKLFDRCYREFDRLEQEQEE